MTVNTIGRPSAVVRWLISAMRAIEVSVSPTRTGRWISHSVPPSMLRGNGRGRTSPSSAAVTNGSGQKKVGGATDPAAGTTAGSVLPPPVPSAIASTKRCTSCGCTARVRGALTVPTRACSSRGRSGAVVGVGMSDGGDSGVLERGGDVLGCLVVEWHQRWAYCRVGQHATVDQAEVHGWRGLDVGGAVVEHFGQWQHPV